MLSLSLPGSLSAELIGWVRSSVELEGEAGNEPDADFEAPLPSREFARTNEPFTRELIDSTGEERRCEEGSPEARASLLVLFARKVERELRLGVALESATMVPSSLTGDLVEERIAEKSSIVRLLILRTRFTVGI